MIEVNRVYVDPTGEVRMSPTGWPKYSDFVQHDKYYWQVNKYNRADKKAKEESIPFEDRSAIMKRLLHYRDLPPGFYTIEPIQVKLIEACNCESCPVDASCEHCQKPVTLARIVTEEEKPAFQMPTINVIDAPYGKRRLRKPAPEASAAFPQFQKCSFLQETHTTATDHTVCQPAPVVDKPDNHTSSIKQALQDKIIEFEAFKTDRRYQSEMEQNAVIVTLRELRYLDSIAEIVQQPTEWIPVSSDIPSPELFNHKEVDIKLCDGSVIVKTIPQFDGDFWSEVLYAFITLDRVTHWRKSLPEPPKP